MSAPPSIVNYLTRLGEPAYGTSLLPSDFVPFASGPVRGWTARARTAEGQDVQYVVWGRPGAGEDLDTCPVRCGIRDDHDAPSADAVDGLRPLLDPFRRTLGEPAPVQDWYDAICMEDAAWAVAQRHQRRWGGAALDDVVTRVEHGISAYEQHEVAVSTFGSLADVQAWIDEALAKTQVRLEALVLTDFPYVPGEMRDGMLLQAVVDDEVVGYAPIAVATNLDSAEWLDSPVAEIAPRPRAELRMSGATRMGMNARFVQAWGDVRAQATLTGGAVPCPDPDGWLILGIIGTDIAVPVPAGAANLLIETDDDGAMVVISVHPSLEREKHHRDRAGFERRWGRWLDDDVVLTDEELNEGIARAEQALRAALAKEAN
jgi:hypothetical protein